MSTAFARKQYDEGFGMASNTPRAELTGKMVYMFLTGMVRDKVGYLVREICKNAWEVGEFEVRLPTTREPVFVVRDYGPGLSDDFMMSRYPKMGDSTKDENGVNGVSGFGAGSKSPLAYLFEDGQGGAYSVESVQDGVKRFYSINLDETGYPQITRMAEIETEERNGLTVSVPVRQGDIYVFHNRAKDILWSFDPRPVITPEINFGKASVLNQGDGWTIYAPTTVPWHGPQIKSGPVMYPLHLNQVDGLSGFLQDSDAIVFDVDPDKIEVTSSRESLQYTSAMKRTLSALATAYEEGYVAGVQAKITEAKTYFEACKAFETNTMNMGHARRDKLMGRVNWRGLTIRQNLDHLQSLGVARMMRLGAGWTDFMRFEAMGIHPQNQVGVKVVIEHNPFRSLERFRQLGLIGQSILWARVPAAQKATFLRELGLTDEDVIVLDTVKLKLGSTATGEKRPKTMRVRRTWNEGAIYKTDIDMSEPHIYIKRAGSRMSAWWVGEKYSRFNDYHLSDILGTMIDLKVIDQKPEIVIINQDDEVGDDWTPAGKYMEDLLRAKVDLDKIEAPNKISQYDIPSDIRQVFMTGAEFSKAPDDLKALKADVDAVRAKITAIETGRSSIVDTNRRLYELLCRVTRVELPEKVVAKIDLITPLRTSWAAIHAKYPLVWALAQRGGFYYGGSNQPLLDHYFDLLKHKEATHVSA